MTPVELSERDLRMIVDAAGTCSDADHGGLDVPDLLAAVTTLVPSDVAFWSWFSLDTALVEHALVPPRHGRGPLRAPIGPWVEHLPEHPIMSGRHGAVTAISDVLPGRALERTWLYQEAMRPAAIRYEIGLELTHAPAEMNVVVLSRGAGRDFSRRDRLVLGLIRPHVDAAVRRVTRPAPPVSGRERQVLRLVRDGLTNAQIGRRLAIAEATVAKHLEHVYARTGARSRTQAVDLCQELLPPN
jgi:DNA-binding CsgD family transcriptional regulator